MGRSQNDDPTHDKWKTENSTIMSWLLRSMHSDISQGYLFLCTTKEIWDAATQTYLRMRSDSMINFSQWESF